jgi:hypothetical protein
MKRFKQFINEEPITDDPEELEQYLYHKPDKKYDPSTLKANFKAKFKILGKGSSRLAFAVNVAAHLFKAKDKKDLMQKDNGSLGTAIKLAYDEQNKGIKQNAVEMSIWHQAHNKPLPVAEADYIVNEIKNKLNNDKANYIINKLKKRKLDQYLCPIIDWAGNKGYGNNIFYKINKKLVTSNKKETAPFWIQMPLCEMNNEIIIKKEFGTYGFPDASDSGKYFRKYINESITIDQLINALACIIMCEKFKLSDLHPGNVGGLNGKPVILDYGFDDKTQQMYWGNGSKNDLVAFINSKGEVELQWGSDSDVNPYIGRNTDTDSYDWGKSG